MTTSTISSAITLVSGERFFLKQIALDPAVPVATQVELVLEESSPFPLAQLYHGFVVSADRQSALGFAAYRRRFTVEELAEWSGAVAVLPDFLGLIGPPPDRPLVVVQTHPTGLVGVAWNGRSGLPVTVLTKSIPEPAESQVEEMVSELRRHEGMEGAEVKRLNGPPEIEQDESGAVFRVAGEETARFSAAAVADADVRDKSFLEEKRRDDTRRRGWTWALMAVSALLLIAAILDVAVVGLGIWNGRRRELVSAQADEVRRIETAQTLATRIEDLAARQEKPLEWLSLASGVRPRSVQFTRVVSNNDRSLTIDAQTADAGSVSEYETALRQREEIANVEMRDIRSRDGLTSFVLALNFKPANSAAKEGQP